MKNQLTPNELFWKESRESIKTMTEDAELQELATAMTNKLVEHRWVYNFSWLGRPIIQTPTDVFALQEMIWDIKPDLIVETGIAHGGSLILEASLLEMLGGDGQVVGIDIDIREHNRVEIERHPMFKRITLLEGSSTDEDIVRQIYDMAKGRKKILVLLDSCHTHSHVLAEMKAYAGLVTKDSYLVVYDTWVEFTGDNINVDRPWGKGDNPYTAVCQFLKEHSEFEADYSYDQKYLITCAPGGRLKKIK